ncbi:cytochrome P450 [Maricaulis sp.]|uniref:cytochrome P450 n=1 Tax=Maricaulis sp. TaxID=1486257 RepID=UPI003457B47C
MEDGPQGRVSGLYTAQGRRGRPSPEQADRPADFLDLLLSAGLDDTAVVDNLLTFLAAGYETTARTLTWTLYLLSQSPVALARLEQELDRADLDPQTPENWTDDLPWTVAVIKESLRLYPSATILARCFIEADDVGGVPIPANTDVPVSTWLLHRHRELWPEPDEFRPERFLGEAGESISRFAYLPFGIGPRVYIGARFAMMKMAIVLAVLLRDLKFQFAGHRHPLPVMRITLQPDVDVAMKVTRRSADTGTPVRAAP